MRIGITTSIATAIAIGVLIASGVGGGGGGGQTPWDGLANVWVDTSGGSCVRSGTKISYPNNGTECSSMSAANTAASTGDVIGIKNGTYAGVTLTGTKTLTWRVYMSDTVTFSSAVTVRNLSNSTFYGPFTSTVDPTVDHSLYVDQCNTSIEFHDWSGGTFDITHTTHGISFYGGSWGGYTARPFGGDPTIGGEPTAPPVCGGDGTVRTALFDGVTFHDVDYNNSSNWGDGHPDCLQVSGGIDGLTIRNSVFIRCGNTFIGTFLDTGDMDNVLIENNLFLAVYDTDANMQIGYKVGTQCDVVFRYNTVDPNNTTQKPPPLINCEGDGTNGDTFVYGNIFTYGEGASGCDGSWTYNVYEDPTTACGTNSTTGTVAYVDRQATNDGFDSSYNYRLQAGANAVNAGQPGSAPTNFPTTDFEGTARTSPPDAGYDER